jgi:hypothetical protein
VTQCVRDEGTRGEASHVRGRVGVSGVPRVRALRHEPGRRGHRVGADLVRPGDPAVRGRHLDQGRDGPDHPGRPELQHPAVQPGPHPRPTRAPTTQVPGMPRRRPDHPRRAHVQRRHPGRAGQRRRLDQPDGGGEAGPSAGHRGCRGRGRHVRRPPPRRRHRPRRHHPQQPQAVGPQLRPLASRGPRLATPRLLRPRPHRLRPRAPGTAHPPAQASPYAYQQSQPTPSG